MMNFFIATNPPTSTAQMKQVRVVKGKPIFYDPPAVKEARSVLSAHLAVYKPSKPLTGPVSLRVLWLFPKGKSHRNGEWRITKPDTDNLQKLLKDCMTRCGFWNDDAQVVREIAEKRWSDDPCGIYIEIEELEVQT
jgi:Holliday junction resolvase RusA-like endonuclease